MPVLTGAARATGTGVGNVFDLLNRAHEATTATITGGVGAGAKTLVHGQSQESQDQTRAELRQKFGIAPFYDSLSNAQWTSPNGNKIPGHTLQGIIDFAIDTGTDPLTYVGGFGLLEHLVEYAGLKSVPALARFLTALEAHGQGHVAQGLGTAFDFLNYKGEALRNLAARSGEKGVAQFKGLKAINNARLQRGQDLASTLTGQFKQITKGLTEHERDELYKAIHTGKEAGLPAELQSRAKAFSELTDTLAYLSGTRGLRRQLTEGNRTVEGLRPPARPEPTLPRVPGQRAPLSEFPGAEKLVGAFEGREMTDEEEAHLLSAIHNLREPHKEPLAELWKEPPAVGKSGGGFILPDWAKRFDTQVRSLQRPSQYRKNYVPTAHDLETTLGPSFTRAGSIEELDQMVAAQARDAAEKAKSGPFRTILEARTQAAEPKMTQGLHTSDPALKPREGPGKMQDTGLQEDIIRGRLAHGAKAITARDAERQVSRLFGVGGFSKVPADAKNFFRETYTKPGGKEFWSGLAKGLIDVPKVGLFALPFRHMANIGTLSVFADPSLANVFGTAGRFGRLMVARSPEAREQILGKAVKYGVTGAGDVEGSRHAGWIGQIPGIGDFYKASNHALWTFDDAAKATRFQRLLEQNMKRGLAEPQAAYNAADQVGAELIDYSNRSPLTKALGYIAPFAAWRTKMPGAVTRALAKHPERILAAGRAAPEMVGDLQSGPPGSGKVGKSYLPVAEAMRAVDNPYEYLRAGLGWPTQMTVSGIEHAGKDYYTYGKPPDLKYAFNATAGSFPGVQPAMTWADAHLGTNLSDWPEPSGGFLPDVLRSQTGFGLARGPTPKNLQAASHVKEAQTAISSARRAGHTAYANALEGKLRAYLQYNQLFEK